MMKLSKAIKCRTTIRLIASLLSQRHFRVFIGNQVSRKRKLKNGLPQGSVGLLVPSFFNVYISDLPRTESLKSGYADDWTLATQSKTFSHVESTLSLDIEHLNEYFDYRKLDVTWNGLELDHYPNPIYLGVTLDRTLSFKQHALKPNAKVNTRNNLLRKLTNSRWGAHPATVRTTALALCFSTAEYACSSWGRSRHTGHVDIALNDTCRIITGCLEATPIPCLYALAGIAPPHIRRKVAANADRCLQEDDPIYPLHGQRPAKHRLPARNSFLDSTEALNTSKQDARTTLWVEEWNALGERSTEWRDRGIITNEHLASGTDEPWSTWRSLNRLRVQKGRCRAMMKMWKLSHTDVCDCGERQTMSHLMTCGDAPNCT